MVVKSCRPCQVLSPEDFGGPIVARKSVSRQKIIPSSPRRLASRAPPTVTANLDAVQHFKQTVTDSNQYAPASPKIKKASETSQTFANEFDATRPAMHPRTISLDTFGRRSLDEQDGTSPSRRKFAEGREDGDPSTQEESHCSGQVQPRDQSLDPGQGMRSTAHPIKDSTSRQSGLTPPKLAAWEALRKEAQEDWEARLFGLGKSTSIIEHSRRSLAESPIFGGPSASATPSATLIFQSTSPFSEDTSGVDAKTKRLSGLTESSGRSPIISAPRASPIESDGRLSQAEPWNFWKGSCEANGDSIRDKGCTDSGSPPDSRHNSVGSLVSSYTRHPLNLRKSSSGFLAGLLGGGSGASSASGGAGTNTTYTKPDRRQLLIRKLFPSDASSQNRKQSGFDASGGRGSPLKAAFPLPAGSGSSASGIMNIMPKPIRRMSVPSRRGRGGFVVPVGMAFPLDDGPADFASQDPSTRGHDGPTNPLVDRLTPVRHADNEGIPHSLSDDALASLSMCSQQTVATVKSSDTEAGAMPRRVKSSQSEESLLTKNDARSSSPILSKRHSHSSMRSFLVSAAASGRPTTVASLASVRRPRSRSDAPSALHEALKIAYTLATPSNLRKIFVPSVDLNAHDEEQHPSLDTTMEQGDSSVDDVDLTYGHGQRSLSQTRRDHVEKLSRILGPSAPMNLILMDSAVESDEETPPSTTSSSPTKDMGATMSRCYSSRSVRTLAATGHRLSPVKLLRRLASSDDMMRTTSTRGETSSVPAVNSTEADEADLYKTGSARKAATAIMPTTSSLGLSIPSPDFATTPSDVPMLESPNSDITSPGVSPFIGSTFELRSPVFQQLGPTTLISPTAQPCSPRWHTSVVGHDSKETRNSNPSGGFPSPFPTAGVVVALQQHRRRSSSLPYLPSPSIGSPALSKAPCSTRLDQSVGASSTSEQGSAEESDTSRIEAIPRALLLSDDPDLYSNSPSQWRMQTREQRWQPVAPPRRPPRREHAHSYLAFSPATRPTTLVRPHSSPQKTSLLQDSNQTSSSKSPSLGARARLEKFFSASSSSSSSSASSPASGRDTGPSILSSPRRGKKDALTWLS